MLSIPAMSDIKPFKAEFLFKGPVLTLNTLRELTIKDGVGTFNFSGKNTLGNLRISSVFEIDENIITSLSYEFKAKAALVINRKQNLIFKNVISSEGDHEWQIDLAEVPEKVLDPLTAQIALSEAISQGNQEVVLFLPNLKNGEIEENKFILLAEETLVIDGVKYECAVAKRVRENENRVTKYWFAKSLDFLLIKTRDEDDNGTVELSMTRILSFG